MFTDRRDAGRQLAEALRRAGSGLEPGRPAVVLALPRGGVVVAGEIARAFQAPLDLVFVRKIGAPHQPELAVAAVADGPQPHTVINSRILEAVGLDEAWVGRRAETEFEEIERRRALYMRDRERPSLDGAVAVVVDDGIATGATTKVALEAVRAAGPAAIVLAVPVAPPETLAEMEGLCDAVVCLSAPSDFRAIGQFYEDFHQISDDEVIAVLDAANRPGGA